MNVDRILIPLPRRHVAERDRGARMLVGGSAEAAIVAGLFDDPCGGYACWVHRSPVIVAWNAIHAAPIECAIRIVRACANKLHLSHLHPELADPLRAAILWGHERGDRFLRVRSLVKLLPRRSRRRRAGDAARARRLQALAARDRRGDRAARTRRLSPRSRRPIAKGRGDVQHHAAFAARRAGRRRSERAAARGAAAQHAAGTARARARRDRRRRADVRIRWCAINCRAWRTGQPARRRREADVAPARQPASPVRLAAPPAQRSSPLHAIAPLA